MEWNGGTWTQKSATMLEIAFGDVYRVEYLSASSEYCLAIGTMADPPVLSRALWSGTMYDLDSIGVSVVEAYHGAAMGPDGEVYFFQLNENADPPFKLSFYDGMYTVDYLQLEGPIKDAKVRHAAVAVSPAGLATIVYQLTDDASQTVYCATFPKPELG